MDNWTFGITMTVVGTGATFIIMAVLVLVIALLKRAFPESPPNTSSNQEKKGN